MAPLNSSIKMPPTTVYVLMKDRLALLDDITDIIKDERITLTSRCIDRLEECLNTNLEPKLIPYDPNDPNRAMNMAASARLRGAKAAGIAKGVTSLKHTARSHRRPDFIPYTRFRKFGGPRNVHESFMDRDFIPQDGAPQNDYDDEDDALANAEAAKHRLESLNRPATNTHSRFGGTRNINESFIGSANLVRNTTLKDNPSAALRASKKAKINASLAYQPSSKKDSFEHPPEGVNSSFYFPHTAPSFARMLPNVDQSAYRKPRKMKERAEPLIKDEPIDIARGDDLVFQGEKLVEYTAPGLRPATKTRHKRVKQAPSTGYQPETILASVETVVENPELTLVKTEKETTDKPQTGKNIDFSETHAEVNHNPQPIPTITITEDAAEGTQNSSSSSHIQNSSQDAQDPQHTPDSTFLGQSQDPSTQSQGLSGQQNIDPNDLLQPSAPAARKKKAPKASKKTTETTLRRSARLAQKTPAPAPTTPTPSQVRKSSAKRSREDDVEDEDEDEDEEQGGSRNKKLISKAAVEKQRETRSKETAKRGSRDRRTALQRRGV